MKNKLFILLCIFISHAGFGQDAPPEYFDLVKKAYSLYNEKDFKASATTYGAAFKIFRGMGYIDDRYNAACSWALAGYPDSAFYNLDRIASKGHYTNYDHLIIDTDLNSLHNDKRWQLLLEVIKANKDKEEINFNKPLVRRLDSIFIEDQKIRLTMDSVERGFGHRSKEMDALWKIQNKKDSINLIKVENILDKHGWLGPDSIGQRGNTTIFLVIQHADLKTQEKYLPMMKEAVKNNNANAAQLALLVDRVEMRNERPQIYGSQMTLHDAKYEPYYIIDIENVDKRRQEVGLGPLEEYVKRWNPDYKLPKRQSDQQQDSIQYR